MRVTKKRCRSLTVLGVMCALAIVELALFATGCASSVRERTQLEGVTRKCPLRKGKVPANENRQASKILVPRGAESVLLCRYFGNEPEGPPGEELAGHLARGKTVKGGEAVRRLTEELNALEVARGTFACPADFGAEIAVFFHYSAMPDDIVKVKLSGCGFVSNERTNKGFRGNARLRRDLLRAMSRK